MNNFEKAKDLYLRGFKGENIKQRTGISIQSLLKQLKGMGITYTKSDIINYQIKYIEKKYDIDAIANAYITMSKKHPDLYMASEKKKIVALGCMFGRYKPVFEHFLGVDGFKKLSAECWQQKQSATVKERYGVDNVFDKSTFSNFVTDEAVKAGRKKREQTSLVRYGDIMPTKNEKVKDKIRNTLQATIDEKYDGVYPMQNKAIAKKANEKRQKTMLKKYGAGNSVEVDEIREKIFNSRKRNGTLTSSLPEDTLWVMLVNKFGESDVFRNELVDNRYPFHVDFYIKSLDLFIELNGHKGHNNHWFDSNSKQDLQVVSDWEKNAIRLEAQSGKKSRYRDYIHIWTHVDVQKRMYAKKNKLNYLVFWDGGSKKINGKLYATLKDAIEWFESGCLMPNNWKKENTY